MKIRNLNESTGVTSADFLSMKAGDKISLDGGDSIFTVQKVNDDNLKLTPKLKQQLQDEGLYDNSYIGFIVGSGASAPFDQDYLPIYGSSKAYVTKWFTNTVKDAVNQNLKDKNMQLIQRANN